MQTSSARFDEIYRESVRTESSTLLWFVFRVVAQISSVTSITAASDFRPDAPLKAKVEERCS